MFCHLQVSYIELDKLHRIEEVVAEEEYKYKRDTVVAQMREPNWHLHRGKYPETVVSFRRRLEVSQVT